MNIFPIVNSLKSVTSLQFFRGCIINSTICTLTALKASCAPPHQHFFLVEAELL